MYKKKRESDRDRENACENAGMFARIDGDKYFENKITMHRMSIAYLMVMDDRYSIDLARLLLNFITTLRYYTHLCVCVCVCCE